MGTPIGRIREYWNAHIHDLAVTRQPVGSPDFFADLDAYHFEKLHHLVRLIDFEAWRGRRVLDVGCGAAVELTRFARAGALATGVELSDRMAGLARENLRQQGLSAGLAVADGEQLPFADHTFDFVYVHGVLPYTADDRRLVAEVRRVVRPGGLVMVQAYNRVSWLNLLSRVMKVPLEHEDAPEIRRYSIAELRDRLKGFASVEIVPERFPVRSRLHGGWKGMAFNTCFVGTFNALPRSWVRRFGWHLLAFCRK
ncbi:MAG TPA: class I SAM-dependent methyltransferase [Vicinamibacterales bacterium]|nr:class I SAM-dependent methyltransferase [Vicinamibacterales bacterium]